MRPIAIALLLLSSSALAFEGEVVDDTFTGCVGPSGIVRDLQRGDEPRRECRGRAEEVRFAATPAGLTVMSWDVVLEFDEEFSPAPGIEIICSGVRGLFSELTIRADDEVMVEITTQTLGRISVFVFHGDVSNEAFGGEPFLVRAAGTGSTRSPEDGIGMPCLSEGFAETFGPFRGI